MPKPKKLISLIHQSIEDSPSLLTARIGGTTYSLSGNGLYFGSLAGKHYAAVMLGEGMTLILERDHSSTAKTMKVISVNGAELTDEQLKEIQKDLLPAPEPPAELQQALAIIQNFKGWKAVPDGKGNFNLVQDDSVSDVRQRAPRGSKPPKEPKPTIVKGLELVRKKDGNRYKVSAVDQSTGYVIFKPLEGGGEDLRTKALKGSGSSQVVPVFWANWSEV